MRTFTVKFLSFFFAIFIGMYAVAQMPAAITIEPEDATASDELTLTFNALEACTPEGKDDLVGLDQVYMHSAAFELGQTPNTWGNYGVDYNQTGANGQSPILTANGDETYSITFTPTEFYGVPEGAIITQLTAVFNGGNWDAEGKDFVEGECGDFYIPLTYASTDPKLAFIVNMNKMIQNDMYDPLENDVYVKMDGFDPFPLEDQLDGTATGFLEEGLEEGQTYTYKFSIDETQDETVERTVTTVGGTVTIDVWWNDDALGQITFKCDMTYQIDMGTFDPENDFLDIAGTVNGWAGGDILEHVGDSIYEVTLQVDPGLVEYKFRINGDWETSEFPGGGDNRVAWGSEQPITLNLIYDKYKPGTWPIKFMVDMSEEIAEGRFVKDEDYLDIAGTINGWGGHNILHHYGDENNIYRLSYYVDTTPPNPNMEFKFRINGSWDNSEFPAGGPNRHWTAVDTAGGVTNVYECIYNVLGEPAMPYVLDLAIEGEVEPDMNVTGQYTFFDPNGYEESGSTYQWYRSPNADGSEKVMIDEATEKTYMVTEDDRDMFLVFEVIPKSNAPEMNTGNPASTVSYQVGHTGFSTPYLSDVKIYPNPVVNELYFENAKDVTAVTIHNLVGQIIHSQDVYNKNNFSINTEEWTPGLYFVVIRGIENTTHTVKIVK